jgi:20S proteasome alpha/beta subunit
VSNINVKTGTTCIGFLIKDAVVLAADRRVTTYKIESDSFTKIFDVSKNAVATIAGHASPAQLFMRYLQSEVKLLELKKERDAKVSEIASILNAFQYSGVRSQGAVVASILGGFDKSGAQLYDMSPDGTLSSHEPYNTIGSGSIFVQGVLDNYYKEDMNESEALDLLDKCFKTSFKNDNASGGGYIVRVVNKGGIKEIERKVVKSQLVSEK